ncbi:MAG: hypothetical protein A2X94_07910 [Bdellovibrionales bacterium GWB1_55_8]|nr:MAG: hypothetical protein A2X94_07910 [Bdellovibrionales bacterium GWB1_55_8]
MSKAELVVITGGAEGLGLSLARQFLADGSQVLITSRDPAKLESARIGLAQMGQVLTCKLDLLDGQSVDLFCDFVLSRMFTSLVLVNNAARGFVGPALSATDDEVQSILTADFAAHVKIIRRFWPRLREGGGLINILSVLAIRPIPDWGLYSAAKAAFANFCVALQSEFRRDRVSVLNVYPGKINTRFTEKSGGDENKKARNEPGGISPDALAKQIHRRFRSRPNGQLYTPISVHAIYLLHALSATFTSRLLELLVARK